ncbi:outer membrane beta-barrel family protein [Bacteroides sp.]|uniref:outer membrane beta-barrel family protein n=1 Tax=Bacteroides sp. TaxID=29523 RepID=UPI002FCBC3FC
MKNKLLLLFLLLSFLTTVGYAQQAVSSSYSIKGVLLDSLTQEGEPYATIRIVKKEAPAKALKMAVTDMKGRFQEKMSALPGLYTLTISSIGKITVVKDFTLKPEEKTVDLGTLYTAEATNELKGVEVIAQKPLVKADIDKIEYNVQDDPDSKSNTVLEMLRKVPLVTVDGEDNIKVNGSSSFKIHVNGKPDNMMSNNPVDVLKSMPANTIKHIEVITNPGAKYDAEGIGGILNIVTIGSGFEGYTATFSGNASNTGGGASAYATIKKGKLTLSGRYSFNLNSSPRSYSNGTQENTAAKTEIVSESSYKSDYGFQSGNLEGSYEIDTLRLISLGFGMYGGNNDGTNEGFTQMRNMGAAALSDPLYSYRTNGNNSGSWYSIRGNLDYQRTSRKNKERMFTLSYKINTRPSTSDSKFWYNDIKFTPEWSDYLDAVLLNQSSNGKQNSSEHTFQADYTTPIAKIHTLETGLKYIIRNNTSDNNRYNEEGEYDAYRSSHYKHLNDIMAAYLGYGIKVKKFSGKAGVRYERTMQDVKYADTPDRNFDSNFNDVVPSASFGFKLTEMSNIRAGYDMRIWRPSIWYLNPYLDDTNPSYIRQGNPNLESEKSHAFNISYSNFTQKFNLNLSLRYSFNNNGIENVTTLVNDKEIEGLKNPTGKEVLYSTYQNIGKSSSAGLSAYVNWNASPKTRIYMNMNADYDHLKSPAQNLENRGWNFFAYGGVQQTLPLDIRVSLNLMGQTPYTTLQGRGSSFYDYSLSVNKSFLKEKRLTLSAFAGNFFQKYQKSSYTTEGVGFKNTSDSKYSRRRFGVSVSYRIGELKASVKKASRSINNDDVKGGGGDGGGSTN